MRVETTRLDGLLLMVPEVHRDDRGFFTRTFDSAVAREHGVDPDAFVQDSQSRSSQGVVRGLHGRGGAGEAKLVRCAHGAVHDVVVDVRVGSPTFGEWVTTVLDDVDHRHLFIPAGFLHGHQTLTPTADVCYRIDREHVPGEDLAARWDDPDLGVEWPLPVTVMSDRDRRAPSWQHLVAQLTSGTSGRIDPSI